MLKHINRKSNNKRRGKLRKVNVLNNTRGISTLDIIITVVAGIIIIVSTVFLIRNVVNLKKVNEEITVIKASIEEKEKTLNKLIELGKNEDILKEDYNRNILYIPQDRDEVGITSDVTHLVLENDSALQKITFSDEVVLENGTTDVPFIVRIKCTYDQLNAFIDQLSKTDRLYIVESVEIVDSNDEGNLVADIITHAYYRKD